MSPTTARVVVTGIGAVVGSTGGTDQLGELLRESAMRCSEIDRGDGYHLPESARLAVLTAGLDLGAWVSPAVGRRMSRPSKHAVAAARMAVEDAGLSDAIGGPRTTVVMATAFGAVQFTERLLRTAFAEGPELVSPFAFTESVANAAAAQVAIANQAQGPNLTIVQREAGGLTAVGRGAAEIAAGRADCALVGAVEEMSPILHALLDRFEALARPGAPGGEVARPFDRRRSGFVAAEGATVLVLENESRAVSRGAKIRAVVRGFKSAFDPSAPRIGWGRGHESLARGLNLLIESAGLATRDIRRIVSGASGAVAGDRLEAQTLKTAWGTNPLPPILAPKAVTGEYGGGFIAAAMLSVSDQAPAATAGFSETDPVLGLTPHLGGPLPAAALTLVTSLASGGAASWLLLEQP